MKRRLFLSRVMRLPALLAAAPIIGGLISTGTVATTEVEPQLQNITLAAIDGQEFLPVAYPGVVYPAGTVFAEEEVTVQNGAFLLREVGPNFVRHLTLGMRQILVRGADGVVRPWALP